jgi:hypothetical protein
MSDYFGEIALLHQCKRTCTVISRNYNTMGRITYDRFRMLLHEYPSLRKSMLKKIYKYCDPKIHFVIDIVKKVDFMSKLSQETMHYLVAKMRQEFFL